MSERDLESVREKRSSRRIRSLNLTSYTPRKGEEQQYIVSIGRTLDVSEGGVKVETHRKLLRTESSPQRGRWFIRRS